MNEDRCASFTLGVGGAECFAVRLAVLMHAYTNFMTSEADLLIPLRRYWGYSSFRPLQERIVRSLLAGHDTCVVMPTGGGKSLCYQLPAVVSERTTVVISPLIALMQDQAAQLAQMGIPAAVLNSSVSNEEQNRVMRQAREGAFRLLYLSPERLQRADTLAWLQQVPISFFAIDEAHCISEWGHEFRPEYRQLSSLRGKFPDRPIAAFTASATRHVRHDILAQLELRNPDKYIASFHRPNLRYLVRECDSVEHTALLVTALRHYDEGNVIVYSPTINKVEETVDFLGDQGIAAVGYHAKMDSGDRRRNQERWMSDEVRVLVGTIAFGLGINKANGAGGHPSGAAQVGGAVLSGGRPRRARWKSRRLHFALAQAGCGPARIFCEPGSGCGRARAGLAEISHDSRVCGIREVPPPADLHALWRDSEVDFVWRL